jgi:peptidoglycan/LPS O-acetylase OafA/YrhL
MILLTLVYSLISVAIAGLIVCMLQDVLTDSHWLFRTALVVLAAGCLATAISVWTKENGPDVWHLVRAVGLFGVILMMRLRQLGRDRRRIFSKVRSQT